MASSTKVLAVSAIVLLLALSSAAAQGAASNQLLLRVSWLFLGAGGDLATATAYEALVYQDGLVIVHDQAQDTFHVEQLTIRRCQAASSDLATLKAMLSSIHVGQLLAPVPCEVLLGLGPRQFLGEITWFGWRQNRLVYTPVGPLCTDSPAYSPYEQLVNGVLTFLQTFTNCSSVTTVPDSPSF